MPSARSNLLARLAILRDSLGDASTADGTPGDTKKNDIAAMLRNGLAVLAFAITEDFIRERTGEVLGSFSPASVGFNDLSGGLQKATTTSALEGVLFRAKFQDKANRISWVLQTLPLITNAATDISKLSPFSFGQASSNLSDEEPTDILAAFGVTGGWATISAISKRVGLGGTLDYSQAFKAIAKRRHAAAHDVSAKIPLNDLTDSLNVILGICCAFDLLLSHALTKHNLREFPNKTNGLIAPADIKLRFISPHPKIAGKIREQVEQQSKPTLRTTKLHDDLARATTAASLLARSKREQLIFLTAAGLPERWETW